MPREPWQPPADGIVEMVGYNHYLVLFYDEAERRFAGPKTGWQQEMQSFEKAYHPITCPTSWRK
jgi:hypothetical protein